MANSTERNVNLKTEVQTVQSHDILYGLSLDILYTPTREARMGVVRWHGRRWTSRNREYGLLWPLPGARRDLARCVQSLASRGLRGICVCGAIRNSVCEALLSAAVSRTAVRGEPQVVCSRGKGTG